MKIGSLCTGYGGLDMATEAAFDAETVWVSDIDKYATQVIEKRLGKPNLGDLKKIDWNSVEPIDILTAGYPCQPFSHAGHRKGFDDERHIWPYIKEAISTLRPSYVVLENVRGHLSLGFKEVLEDLASLGYDARWKVVRAAEVGAPHHRARLFVLAYPNSQGPQGGSGEGRGSEQSSSTAIDSSNQLQPHNGQVSGQLGLGSIARRDMSMQAVPTPMAEGKLNPVFVEYMMGLPEGWVTDCGLSRTQQLKMLGNGVVPQQAYYAIQQLRHAV